MSARQIDISNFCDFVEIDRRKLVRFIHELDAGLPEKFRALPGVLSIAVFNDADLARIHADFMNKPTPTDVITFEGDDEMLGEICASAERALDWSKKFGTTPSQELSLYVAHGYLHLAGIDDISESDALVMRKGGALAMDILREKFKTPIFKFNV